MVGKSSCAAQVATAMDEKRSAIAGIAIRLDRRLKREPDFVIGRPFVEPSRNQVRVFNYINQLTKKY